MKKFDPIRAKNARLAEAVVKAARIKVNHEVTSQSDVVSQVHALRALFVKLRVAKVVTAKVGLWYKKMPVVDVIVDFTDVEPRNGEEAGELGKLMLEAYALVRQAMAQALPGMTQFAPERGVVLGAWRFQC